MIKYKSLIGEIYDKCKLSIGRSIFIFPQLLVIIILITYSRIKFVEFRWPNIHELHFTNLNNNDNIINYAIIILNFGHGNILLSIKL